MSDINEIVDEIMEVEEPDAEAPAIDADALIDGLTAEEPAKQEEPDAQEPETKEPEQTPEEARKAELSAGLNELLEDGYTVEEIETMCKDAQVRADIQAGKSLHRAVSAYERRQKAQPAAASAKRGVPTVTRVSSAGAKDRNRIEEMSDKEFDEFSRRAVEAAKSGKKVKIR